MSMTVGQKLRRKDRREKYREQARDTAERRRKWMSPTPKRDREHHPSVMAGKRKSLLNQT